MSVFIASRRSLEPAGKFPRSPDSSSYKRIYTQ